MLPPGLALLDMSLDFEGLSAHLNCRSVHRRAFDSLPSDDVLEQCDLVSTCGAIEQSPVSVAVLERCARHKTAVVTYVLCTELAGVDALPADRFPRRYTIAEFEDQAGQAGLDVAARLLVSFGVVFLLLPVGEVPGDRWWLEPMAAALIRRHRIRGERQLVKFRATEGGQNWEFASDQWRRRAVLASSLIPPGLAIMDIGCGAMYLEQVAAPRHYVPVDAGSRDERTKVIDLNKKEIPPSWLDDVDLVACLGVFEYLENPERIIQLCADHGKRMLVSYNFKAIVAGENLKIRGSTFSADEMETLFANHNYVVKDKVPFGNRQYIWVLDPQPDTRQPRG